MSVKHLPEVTKVWRFQDACGQGPYIHDVYEGTDELRKQLTRPPLRAEWDEEWRFELRMAHTRDRDESSVTYKHPGPRQDGLAGVFEQKHRCAFVNREDAFKWFEPEWVRRMEKHGITLQEVAAKPGSVYLGDGEVQAIYLPAEENP